MAVQVDPIKPTLKAPEFERLKLQCYEPLSNFAFKFKLRRYNEEPHINIYSGFEEECIGRAVRVDPIRPTLKAPGSVLSKLRYDGPVSNCAFNLHLRRYASASTTTACSSCSTPCSCGCRSPAW
jgi:hypothetical protein